MYCNNDKLRHIIPLDMFVVHKIPWQLITTVNFCKQFAFWGCVAWNQGPIASALWEALTAVVKSQGLGLRSVSKRYAGEAKKAQLVDLWSIKPAALVLNMNDHEASSFACIGRCYTFAYWRVVVSGSYPWTDVCSREHENDLADSITSIFWRIGL